MRILVVDDSIAARMLIKKFIRQNGEHEIIEAANGKEAVEYFLAHAPDFTFLDLTMPVMDGFEALRLIKESTPKALVAVLSADIQQKAVDRVKDLGAVVFINKPVTENRINSVLKTAQSIIQEL